MLVFLDTEFTNFHRPNLLSIGMVSLAGAEFYCELDIESLDGRLLLVGASEFVRGPDVLGQWGKVPGATCSAQEMGGRAGQWLLDQADLSEAAGATHPLVIASDYDGDFELLQRVLQESDRWAALRPRVRFEAISRLLAREQPHLAAEAAQASYAELARTRGIGKHHALADALALRAEWRAVKLAQLLAIANAVVANSTEPAAADFDVAKWLDHWMQLPQPALGGRKPFDLIGAEAGFDQVVRVLGAIESGAFQ